MALFGKFDREVRSAGAGACSGFERSGQDTRDRQYNIIPKTQKMGDPHWFSDEKRCPFSNNIRPSINQWKITFMKSTIVGLGEHFMQKLDNRDTAGLTRYAIGAMLMRHCSR